MPARSETRPPVSTASSPAEQALPGDPRDTTTPGAMVRDLNVVLLGKALSDASRVQVENWLLDSKITGHLLHAGLPNGWHVGDKSGSGERGTRNDIAIIMPPEAAPILAAVFYTESAEPLIPREGYRGNRSDHRPDLRDLTPVASSHRSADRAGAADGGRPLNGLECAWRSWLIGPCRIESRSFVLDPSGGKQRRSGDCRPGPRGGLSTLSISPPCNGCPA